MTKTKAIVSTISLLVTNGCMAACPYGVGVYSAFGASYLVPFGVCSGGMGMYFCNSAGTAVKSDICYENNMDAITNPDNSGTIMTPWFSNFTCDAVEDCDYLITYDFTMETADVETCESEEQLEFGDSNCERTVCTLPSNPEDIYGKSYVIWPNNPFMHQLHKSHEFLTNECTPVISYVPSIGGWGPNGQYLYRRIYSCDPDFSGNAMIESIYSDDNCTTLVEEEEIPIQNDEDSPVLVEWDHDTSRCRKIAHCSDESILVPTIAPTMAPTNATVSPTSYPSQSPTSPTSEPTNVSSDPNTESTSMPANAPTNAHINNANMREINVSFMILMALASYCTL